VTTDAEAVAMNGPQNQSWNLKSFMDSLIVELDRAQDALAIKGITRPVTYTVKDVEVDLRCFPQYDGRAVSFLTAQPGQDGASGLRFSLGSISAGTIRDSTPPPTEAGDVRLDALDDLAPAAKRALEAVGVRTGRDVERMAASGVDLRSATGDQVPDYSDLAALITKAHRRRLTPRVDAAHLSIDDGAVVLHVDGDNLAVAQSRGFPYALLDGRQVPVLAARPERLTLDAAGFRQHHTGSRLTVALDPYALITMELRR
jgi:hypothetical protein